MLLANPFKLKSSGVMGMNHRNFGYISKYNNRSMFPVVDNKLLTKERALEYDIAVPDLLSVVRFQHDVEKVFETLKQHSGFCIKPAKGSGGRGILVVLDSDEKGFRKASGEYVNDDYIVHHISNTLAGLFSLGGAVDVAMVEQLVQFDPLFEGLSFEGVPDIRIIVFKGYPIMAMARLATRASDGKANLHQGAVGVGVDILSGRSTSAVQHNRPIDVHPDTGRSLLDLQIEGWDGLLELAASCYEMSELGYLGVDIVLDKQHGPLVLELNARPGLAIQIANQKGLLPRLQQIESLNHKRTLPVKDRISYIMQAFTE